MRVTARGPPPCAPSPPPLPPSGTPTACVVLCDLAEKEAAGYSASDDAEGGEEEAGASCWAPDPVPAPDPDPGPAASAAAMRSCATSVALRSSASRATLRSRFVSFNSCRTCVREGGR